MFACAFPGTGSVDQGFSLIIPQAADAVPVTVSADMNAKVVATGSVFIELRFLNSSGTEINTTNRPRITATNGLAQMKRYSVTATSETGTASITVVIRFTGTLSINSVVGWRNIKLEIGSVATPYQDNASQMGNQLTVPNSGYRLGDLRNQVMVGVGNYGAGWSGGSITYSASSTSATISAAAATLQIGGSSLAYSASSVTVSGTGGTTVTYYLYYDDPGYTGGAKTLNATTNQITSMSADGRVAVGKVAVTFPTSGTGSGGGGSGCPQVDEPVIRRALDGSEEVIRAGDVRCDDYLLLANGHWGRVTHSVAKLQPGVRVTGADGSAITCSESAPLETAEGPCVPATHVRGLLLKHRRTGVMRAANVEDLGEITVQHITCENDCFWVGDYSHHNLKP
jgi:hypothetical protein